MRREAQPSGHGSGLPSTSSPLLAAKQSDKDMKVEGPVWYVTGIVRFILQFPHTQDTAVPTTIVSCSISSSSSPFSLALLSFSCFTLSFPSSHPPCHSFLPSLHLHLITLILLTLLSLHKHLFQTVAQVLAIVTKMEKIKILSHLEASRTKTYLITLSRNTFGFLTEKKEVNPCNKEATTSVSSLLPV